MASTGCSARVLCLCDLIAELTCQATGCVPFDTRPCPASATAARYAGRSQSYRAVRASLPGLRCPTPRWLPRCHSRAPTPARYARQGCGLHRPMSKPGSAAAVQARSAATQTTAAADGFPAAADSLRRRRKALRRLRGSAANCNRRRQGTHRSPAAQLDDVSAPRHVELLARAGAAGEPPPRRRQRSVAEEPHP